MSRNRIIIRKETAQRVNSAVQQRVFNTRNREEEQKIHRNRTSDKRCFKATENR